MPLKKSSSKKAFEENMHELSKNKKRSNKQNVAIAFSIKEEALKKKMKKVKKALGR